MEKTVNKVINNEKLTKCEKFWILHRAKRKQFSKLKIETMYQMRELAKEILLEIDRDDEYYDVYDWYSKCKFWGKDFR